MGARRHAPGVSTRVLGARRVPRPRPRGFGWSRAALSAPPGGRSEPASKDVPRSPREGGHLALAALRLEAAAAVAIPEPFVETQNRTRAAPPPPPPPSGTRRRARGGEAVPPSLAEGDDFEEEEMEEEEEEQVEAAVLEGVDARAKGLLMLNLLTLLFGSNVVFVKQAEAVMDPETFTALRFACASAVFLPVLPGALRNRPAAAAGLELGTWAAMAYGSQALGLLTCDAGRVAFLSALTVVVVPLIAGMWGRPIGRRVWAAVAVAVAGLALLEGSGSAAPGIGDAWTLMSATLFGVHILRTEHHSVHLQGEGSNVEAVGVQMLVLTAVFGAVALGAHPAEALDLAAAGPDAWGPTLAALPWGLMLYTGVLATAGTLWLEVESLKHVPAEDAALVYTAEPVWGAALAWVLLGERWGAQAFVGAALIVASSVASQLRASTPPTTAATDAGAAPETPADGEGCGAAAR